MTEEPEAIYFESPQAFRAWLEEHHATAAEVWVGYWKTHTGRRALSWSEAVDEALCFGWIDSVARRVDGDRSRQRFTPRRRGSTWSRINIAKVAELERQGRMTEAGRAAFEARREDRSGVYSYENGEVELTPEYAARLAASPAALAFFESQPPSYRRTVQRWVMSAKKEETRDRRMAELVADCEAERLVKPLRYGRNKPAS